MTDLPLHVVAETARTITLGWEPPVGVEWYTFWRDGVRVANAPPADKAGVVKRTVRFSKGKSYGVRALGAQAVGSFAASNSVAFRTLP